MVIESNSPEETFRVGKELGERAYAGQVFTLTGDLGVGKTVFTQGLAKGLGIDEPVNSPTFTIVQEYDGGRRGDFPRRFHPEQRFHGGGQLSSES